MPSRNAYMVQISHPDTGAILHMARRDNRNKQYAAEGAVIQYLMDHREQYPCGTHRFTVQVFGLYSVNQREWKKDIEVEYAEEPRCFRFRLSTSPYSTTYLWRDEC